MMTKEIPGKVQAVLDETRVELQKIYPKRLKEMILFGSYARGDFIEGSDIDIVLLLEQLTDITTEREQYLPVISRICLKHDTVVSIIPFDSQEFQNRETPLILNVMREGMKIATDAINRVPTS